MKYWLLGFVFLTGCVTTSSQQAETEWCFICWRAKVKLETMHEKTYTCDTNLINCSLEYVPEH